MPEPTPPIDQPNIEQSEKEEKTSELEKILEKKQEIIKAKKEKFNMMIRLIRTVILVVILVIIGGVIYYKIQEKRAAEFRKTQQQQPVIENPAENPASESKYKTFSSDIFKLSFDYLKEASLSELSSSATNPTQVKIIYSRTQTADDPATLNEKITEGYIFKISLLSFGIRQLDEITGTKKASFSAICPSTSTISDISGINVNNVIGRTFEVKECNGDTKVIYLPKFGNYYEIQMIQRGDVGYRQQYRLATEEILNSLKFYPENNKDQPEPPFTTYYNEQFRFSFEHPKLDSECCKIDPPASGDYQFLGVFADKNSKTSDTSFDGFAIFSQIFSREEGFNEYLNTQKQTFIEDYKVVTGYQPNTEEKDIKVGNLDGKLLKGYLWKGDDLIYVELPNISTAIIIVEKNKSGESFKKVFDNILASFDFF